MDSLVDIACGEETASSLCRKSCLLIKTDKQTASYMQTLVQDACLPVVPGLLIDSRIETEFGLPAGPNGSIDTNDPQSGID